MLPNSDIFQRNETFKIAFTDRWSTEFYHRETFLSFESLIEHLLGRLFEFAATVHVIALLGSGCAGPILSCLAIWLGRLLLVNDHALGVPLGGGCTVALVTGLHTGCTIASRGLGLLANNRQHTILQCLFIL